MEHYSSFWVPLPSQNSNANPISRILNTRAGNNLHFFDRNRRSLWTDHEIGPWLLWITNRKSQVSNRSVSIPLTLSDLERRDTMLEIFPAALRTFDHTVWPTVSKFSTVTDMGDGSVTRGSCTIPLPLGRATGVFRRSFTIPFPSGGATAPQNFWKPPTWTETFTRSTTPPSLAKIFVTRMLTRDLFCDS